MEIMEFNEVDKNPLDVFTDEEAASALHISRIKLWDERKKGRISFRRAGRRLLYTRQDLVEYLERQKIAADA